MRWILVVLAVLLVLSPIFGAGPTKYTEYNVEIDVLESGAILGTVGLVFPESVDTFNYYFLHPVYGVSATANGLPLNCSVTSEVLGTLLECSEFNASSVEISYEYLGLVSQQRGYSIISDRFVFSTPTDNFSLNVILPQGYVIAEDGLEVLGLESYTPNDASRGTDGRKISLSWERTPKLGELFTFSVVYEGAVTSDNRYVIIVSLLVVLLLVLMFFYFRRKPTLKEYGLNNDERAILDVLLKQDRVTQKKICRKTGFSKAHVSRLARDMEERGLIERKKRGRSYEVILKR